MKSWDPWSVIATNRWGDVVVPAPVWGNALYEDVPSWIHYGNPADNQRLLFDGAFVGAEAPSRSEAAMRAYTGRSELTAAVAPVVAPATGGITVKKELDDKQVLRVEICVDGKCHRTSMDLAPAISDILAKLAQWHKAQHSDGLSPVAVGGVIGAVDAAIGEATNGMVAALVQRHIDTVCGGFLDDITGAIGSVASGIADGVTSTFNALKGPISAAAGIAATAGAAAIPGVGPIVAPIAGKLANDIVSAATGNNAAKKRVAQAKQQAQTNPAIAAALQQAQKAVAGSTVAHHVSATAKAAARGQPVAQRQIAQLANDAVNGDPAAQAVTDIVTNAMQSEWGANLWNQLTGRGPADL